MAIQLTLFRRAEMTSGLLCTTFSLFLAAIFFVLVWFETRKGDNAGMFLRQIPQKEWIPTATSYPSTVPENFVSISDAAWPEYMACAARGSEKAAVDEALLREYAQQGEGFLDANSIVVDVGGFVGEAVHNFLHKFACRVFIFEPVQEYAHALEKRFQSANDRVVVLNYGIGSRDENVSFVVDGDRSHISDAANADKTSSNSGGHVVQMRTLTPFFDNLDRQHGTRFVDLMHINCEGCEFAVLEYLLRSPWIFRIRHLLVQFHSFRDIDAVDRRCTLRSRLVRTHKLAWDRAFVWERWDLQESASPDKM